MTFEEYYAPIFTLYDFDDNKVKDIMHKVETTSAEPQESAFALEKLHELFISRERIDRVRTVAYLYRLYREGLVVPIATAVFYYNGRLNSRTWRDIVFLISIDDSNPVVMCTNELVKDVVFNTKIDTRVVYDFIEVALKIYYKYNMSGLISHTEWKAFDRKFSDLVLAFVDDVPQVAKNIHEQLAVLAGEKLDVNKTANFNPHELELLDRLWRLATAQDKVDLLSGEITLSQLITKTSKLYNATKS